MTNQWFVRCTFLAVIAIGAAFAPAVAQFGPLPSRPGGGMNALDLTSEQQARLQDAVRQCREQSQDRQEAVRACVEQRLNRILTTEQRAKLRSQQNGERDRDEDDGPALTAEQKTRLQEAVRQCREQNQDPQAMRGCVQERMRQR